MTVPTRRMGVVVLNWNGRPYLEGCLSSLAEQDHPDHFVVLVDNGSEDGSADFVRTRFPGVEILELGENRRFAGGNNAGAAHALERGADVLLILNNDTEATPGFLRSLDGAFEDPAVGIAGPRVVHADRPERIWYGGGRFDPAWGFARHRALRARVGAGADPAGPTDWVTGCALAVRAEVWRELGGLDEEFYIYAEDVDFCLRARAAGWSVAYVPAAVLHHAVSASVGGRMSRFKAYHRTRSRRQLARRHAHGLLAGPTGFLYDAALAGFLLLRGAPGAAGAVFEAVFESPSAEPRHPTRELRGDV